MTGIGFLRVDATALALHAAGRLREDIDRRTMDVLFPPPPPEPPMSRQVRRAAERRARK